MNITKINNNISFGKEALMTCQIKDKKNQERHNAVLYKLDPENLSDVQDVYFSKQTNCIYNDFMLAGTTKYQDKEFFIIQNDKTKEVISCAETSHRFSPFDNDKLNQYTLIEEAKGNKKYIGGIEAMFAYITQQALDRYDNSVVTAFDEETVPELETSKFSKTKTGEYYIPLQEFGTVIDQAEKQYHIEYLI